MSGWRQAGLKAAGDHLTSNAAAASLDCTVDCRLEQHSESALSCAYLGNIKLLQHCTSVCANPFSIADAFGRNVLHVAASRGHLHLVRWLLTRKKVAVNVADWESRWTALHRAIFYGHLGVGVYLAKSGGDLNARDSDGYTPLSILNEDREKIKSSLDVISTSVYTWGRNSNVTLGHDHSRNIPEKLDLLGSYSVSQVVLCKFHSVFLTSCGRVLTSGHGPGGRLGHDSEQSIVAPYPVKALSTLHCTAIAAARDHTVILTKSGAVLTCGLNDAHQLGHGSNPSNAPPNYLAPKQVKALKNKVVILVGAGRYHTAMCTSSELYTVGKNLGQLGYEKTYETQISPHTVAGINLDQDDVIVHMSTSDSATAIMTKKNRIFVCTDFTVKTVRCGFFEKTSCVQFSVCASLHDMDYLRKVDSEPTKLLMLGSDHLLWCWEPTRRGSVPYVMPGLARLSVTHFFLGKSLTVVTEWGEVYSGQCSVGKPLVMNRLMGIQNAKAVFTDFKANNFAYIQNSFRAPFLPDLCPSCITSDLTDLLEEACLPGGVSDLTIQAAGGQCFPTHKFILASASQQFLPHVTSTRGHQPDSEPVDTIELNCSNSSVIEGFLHYVYGAHLKVIPPNTGHTHGHTPNVFGLGNGFPGTSSGSSLEPETTSDTSFNASVDENDLTGVYDQFFARSYSDEFADLEIPRTVLKSTPKKRSVADALLKRGSGEIEDAVKELHLVDTKADLNSLLSLATTFGMKELKTRVESIIRSLSTKKLSKPVVLVRSKLELKVQSDFSDLSLISEEGESIPCHRCVLVARSEYFRSMLLMGWRESSENSKSLSLPVRYKVLKAVIEYIYTDECPAITESSSLEWVCSVLVIADQLLLTRLKNLCERALAKALTLRNVAELLEFAEAYCADQLKKSCLQFICVNAACFVEGRYLDSLEDSLLNELSTAYLSMVPAISKRVFKFRDPDMSSLPETYFLDIHDKSDEDLSDSECHQPTPNGRTRTDSGSFRTPSYQDLISPRTTASGGSRRRRRRKNSQSDSKRRSSGVTSPIPTCVSPVDTTPTVTKEATPVVNGDHSPELFTPVGSGRRRSSNSTSGRPGSSEKTERARTRLLGRFETASSQESGDEVPVPHASSTEGAVDPKETTEAERESPPKKSSCNGGSVVQPVLSGRSVKGGWASLPRTCGSTSTSLREIMAKEEKEEVLKEQRKQVQRHKSPPPIVQEKQPLGKGGRSGSIGTARSQPLLVPDHRRYSQQQQQDSPVASPSAAALSPTVNPWRMSGSSSLGASPPVSMREVMAEAEAEQKKRRRQSDHKLTVNGPHRTSGEKIPSKRAAPSIPHQQVSFASIVRAQKMEEQQSRAGSRKSLALIQIEEEAILELENVYSARDNPDEFITVERCRPASKLVHSNKRAAYRSQHSHDSPWGKDHV